jgi:hypothetical protein
VNHAVLYEGESKIFWNDTLKIIKLTIRPIGHHHSRSSSLPHVDTGPTISFILGMLPGSPFLLKCKAVSAIRLRYHQWYQTGILSASVSFLEIGRRHRVPIQRSAWVRDNSHLVFHQKLLDEDRSVRRVVLVKQPDLFSPKFGAMSSHVWPIGTSASCYHNRCTDGDTSPEYFGYCLVCIA